MTKNETHRICSLEKAKQYEAFKNFEWEDLKDFKIMPQYIPKKVILKNYDEYNVKYTQYLKQIESKNQELHLDKESINLPAFNPKIPEEKRKQIVSIFFEPQERP